MLPVVLAFAAALYASSASAQPFPDICVTEFGYTPRCCAASYRRTPAGKMEPEQRHAEIKSCSQRERSQRRHQDLQQRLERQQLVPPN